MGKIAKVVPEGQTRDRARAVSVTRSLRTCLSDLKTFLLFVRTTLQTGALDIFVSLETPIQKRQKEESQFCLQVFVPVTF